MQDDKLQLPPFRALLAFHAAATHERMVEAAASLGVTESAVSHQLRQLEDLLHVELFDRSSGRLRLTAKGQRYLSRIEPALLEIQRATEAIAPSRGRSTVRLTLPPSLAVTWLIPRLGRLEQAHPHLDIQLVPTTRVIDLGRQQVDAAIRYGKGTWPNVNALFLFDDLATPVAAPGYVIPDSAPPDAPLAGARLIVNRSVPHEWEEWAKARGLEPPVLDGALHLDSIEQVLQVAQSGGGLAMGRSPYIEQPLADGRLVAPFGLTGPTETAYYLCRPSGETPSAAMRRLEEWLVAEAEAFQAEQSGMVTPPIA